MLRVSIGRTVKLGLKSLLLHKLRTALTMLGILFGVASVIAMLAIGEGASAATQERIAAMGSRNLIVESRKPPESQVKQIKSGDSEPWRPKAYGLTYADATAAATLPAVKTIARIRQMPIEATYREVTFRAQLIGTEPAYLDVSGLRVAEGRFLVALDSHESRNTAVLGAEVAKRLFPFSSPLGELIGVGFSTFRVVGVLARPESSAGGIEVTKSLDAIFVALSALRSHFGEITFKFGRGSQESERVELHRMLIQTGENSEVLSSARSLRALLAHHHKEEDYALTVPLELLRQAEETKRVFNIVLGSIAAISLLVGGIGIMNVMLATVTERTNEIGVRRAMGARRSHILAQFLVETLALSSVGGILGVLIGVAVPAIVTHFSDLKTVVAPEFPLIAFLIAAGVGVLFGLYPAWRAAHLDPIAALRHT